MKKVKVLLILIFVFIVTAILGSEIYAANTMDLNITDIRPYTSKKYTVTTPNGNIHTIFKIMKRNGAGYTYEDALYCLRSGIGFGDTEFAGDLSEVADVTYTESYNLKTDATAVMNYYRNTIGYNITNTEYNAMLWIIDNMYLPEHPDSAQMKTRLLEKAEILNSELTDDDIEFIQQMALWYFANYDDNGGQNSLSLADTYVLSNTTKVEGESLSETKARQIDTLYRYFIENAKLHVADYGTGNSRDVAPVKPEIQVNSSSKTVTTSNGYVVVGPFNITETSGNVGYDLEILVKDKNGKIIPEKQDETPIIYIVKNPADMTTDISSVEEAIGEGDFYLKISSLWSAEFDLTDVNIEANCTYDKMYKTTATLWLAEAEDQPVIKVEKEEILEGKFNLNINKVDEEGNLLPGAAFTIITEDRRVIAITNNGDGTFTSADIAITSEGEEFIFEIEEIKVPGGYIGIVEPFKVKITTKLNTTGTGYIVDEIKFLDSTGAEIPTVPGVTYELIDNTITLKVENQKTEGKFNLNINKVDEEGNLLPGAEFTIRTEAGEVVTVTNNGDGTFTTGDMAITTEGQEFIFEIEETRAPNGYIGITGAFRIKVTTKLNADKTAYIIDEVKFIDSTGAEIPTVPGVTYELIDNTITLKVENQKTEGKFNLNINKVDEEGNLLPGAEFTIRTEAGEVVTVTNNGDGTFTTGDMAITTEGQEFIFEIEETRAPNGYIGITGAFRIKVTTKLNADKTAYIIDEVKFIDSTGAEIPSISGIDYETEDNTITIKVKNQEKKIEGKFNLNINKIDEDGILIPGAEFTIETEDGRTISVTDNGKGRFTTGDIAITTEGEEFILKIEETTAPNGYVGIIGAFRIKVTTKLNTTGTGYIVDEIKFLDSTGAEIPTVPGVTYELIDNTITLKVENQKTEGKFNLNINKVDEEGNLLPGAEFTIRTEAGEVVTVTNNGDGTFTTGDMAITTEGQEFIFEIEETRAPNGYIGITGAFRIKVTTKLNADKTAYIIDEVKFIDSTGAEIPSISGIDYETEDNTITIKVKNQEKKIEGKFNLNINKIDEDGILIPGAEFTIETEDGRTISVTDNGKGRFTTGDIAITTEGEEFIFKIEETTVPNGYIGITGAFRIKVTTKLNADKTAYTIDEIKFIDSTGDEIPAISGITYELIDNTIILKVENREKILEGKFNLNINKVDEDGNLLPGAAFTIITEDRRVITVTNNGDGTFTTEDIAITTEGEEFIFEIEEIKVPGGYIGIVGSIRVKVTTKLNTAGTGYIVDEIKFLDSTGAEIPTVPGVTYELIDNTITLKVENKKVKVFDLALRKYITEINGNPDAVSPSKIPNIDTSKLETDTTADYKHRKDPVEVKTGDKVTYTISVYNEGDIEGIVTEIIDYLPEGLEFDPNDNPELIEYKTSYTETELAGKKYAYTYDATTRTIRILPITGTYLFRLDPYDGTTLDTDSLEIVCKVTATKVTADKILTNIATMKYKPANVEDESINDRDSSSDPSNLNLPTNTTDWENYKGNPNNKPYLGDTGYFYEGQEDDDDFDKVIIKGVPFDLALRKFITKVNGEEVESRVPEVDTSKLNTIDETTGEKIETATYKHSKEPVVVKQGDIVTYKIRVYNEGDLDGYATEIADYIPEGLGYLLDYKANTDNFWVPVADETTTTIDLVGTEGLYQTESAIKNLQVSDFNGKTSLSEVKILAGKAKIYSTALEDEIIKAYNPELTSGDIDATDNWQQSVNGTDGLYYREVEVTCIVLAENTFQGTLRNIAEIQEDKAVDENGDEISTGDRDSTPDNVDTDNYNPPTDNSTYQEDDDDYEPLELRYFDLALRKFITGVNDEEITTRIPEPTVKEDGTIEYVHDKTPIYVANSDVVTYTIRVYNEGTVLGYAMEVSDDIPDGLEFLPDHATNQEYGWKMYDANGEETTNPAEAVEIRTRYLENDLLNPYDPTKEISVVEPLNPDYAEVKVAFKVVEKDITQEDRIIINKAQITEDKAVDEEGNEIDIDDEDSIPDEWNEGEDDQDIEKIYVKEFDLALLKWVTQTIVTVDGNTTVTDTGFTPYDDPEPIAKVVIDKNKLDRTTVKFVYNIIIMNQGEIPGYATEITDYIPEGLEFIPEDNPIWTKVDDNKITTRALEGTLLQPGESATLEVVFTWKKDPDNLGLKTNIAEISEDYNDKGSEDVDSTPDNVDPDGYDEQQEDDDDKALVILELHTGGFVTSYMWLILTVLLIITGGILLIKKYVI